MSLIGPTPKLLPPIVYPKDLNPTIRSTLTLGPGLASIMAGRAPTGARRRIYDHHLHRRGGAMWIEKDGCLICWTNSKAEAILTIQSLTEVTK